MNALTPVVFAAVSFLAMPAFAQSSPAASGSATPAAVAASSGEQTSSSSTKDPADSVRMQQKITSDLEKDGFKNVHVVADSFLVNAENKEGQKVVMIINPDSVFSMTQAEPDKTSGNSTSSNAKK